MIKAYCQYKVIFIIDIDKNMMTTIARAIIIITFPSEASLIASQMIPYKQLLLSSASFPPFNINPLPNVDNDDDIDDLCVDDDFYTSDVDDDDDV